MRPVSSLLFPQLHDTRGQDFQILGVHDTISVQVE